MYKVGKVTHAALNNELYLLIYYSTMTCKEGPAKIYLAMMMNAIKFFYLNIPNNYGATNIKF